MPPELTPPLVLGWDVAGVVDTPAEGFDVGQRVVGMLPWFDTGNGANAEAVLAETGWLAALPAGVDDISGATLPLSALTARQALDLLDLRSGQTLLVTGASGAVGGAAVQLAAAAGVHVVAVASRGDEDYVGALGATQVLGRADPGQLVAAARSLLSDGVDAVFDAVPVGPPIIGAVRDGGAVVTVLDPAAPAAERGIRVDEVDVSPDAAQLRDLVDALATGKLVTRVADIMQLAEAAQAHQRAAAGGLRGKIVLTI